jgi:hypothetical protein
VVEDEQMQRAADGVDVPHRHRKRKKRRSLKRRVLKLVFVVLFLAAWGFGVMKLTRYLGREEDLGQKYHQIDPAGFKQGIKAGGSLE